MDKDMNPVISVLMPVFNAEKYIRQAIESILSQSFKDFELLIFNDCSTDESLSIILSFEDPRIKVFNSPRNLGYLVHLNNGIKQSRSKYIARMDADDICHPYRFEKQIAFMESHKEFGLLGTWAKICDRDELLKPSTDDLSIRLDQLKMNQFIHSSVLIRKTILEKYNLNYDKELYTAEDYDLWVRISEFCKIGNLSEVLIQYRVHNSQISAVHSDRQINNANKIRIGMLEKLLEKKLNDEEKKSYLDLINNIANVEDMTFDQIKFYNKLKYHFKSKAKSDIFYHKLSLRLEADIFNYIRNHIIKKFVLFPNKYNLKLLRQFVFYQISPFIYLKIGESIRFVIKCLTLYKRN
jgi:glycosyltransferase involved in cell wall biosynthesis